jgi:hypothetical protein
VAAPTLIVLGALLAESLHLHGRVGEANRSLEK